MNRKKAGKLNRGAAIYLTGLLMLFAVLLTFVPLVYVDGPSGEPLPLDSVKLLFGGTTVLEGDGGYISFATYLNFYLLAAEQCLLLSALAAFLAKGSFRLSIVSAFFGLAGAIMILLSPIFVNLTNGGLLLSDLHLCAGSLLCAISAFAGVGIAVYIAVRLKLASKKSAN